MAVTVRLLDDSERLAFRRYTYPRYQELLKGEEKPELLAAGLFVDGEPAGLALGSTELDDGDDISDLLGVLSLVVDRSQRGYGYAGQLLQCLEAEARRRDLPRMRVVVEEDENSGPLLKTLAREGWEDPISIACVGRVQGAPFVEAPWYRDWPLPEGFQLGLWSELSPEQKEEVRKKGEAGWFPRPLSPFRNLGILEPTNSVVLLQGNQVVGWQVCHRIRKDTIRYSALFMDPELETQFLGIAVLVEAMRRHVDMPRELRPERAVFLVYSYSKKMTRLMRRRMRPYTESFRDLLRVEKRLEEPTETQGS